MSFKAFIYYCAVCGGWAAFLVWALVQVLRLEDVPSEVKQTTLIAGFLGVLLAAAVGAVDALLNAVGSQRYVRVGVCGLVGLAGGLLSGLFGEVLHTYAGFPKFL